MSDRDPDPDEGPVQTTESEMDPELCEAIYQVQIEMVQSTLRQHFHPFWLDVPGSQKPRLTYEEWYRIRRGQGTLSGTPDFATLTMPCVDWEKVPTPVSLFEQALRLDRTFSANINLEDVPTTPELEAQLQSAIGVAEDREMDTSPDHVELSTDTIDHSVQPPQSQQPEQPEQPQPPNQLVPELRWDTPLTLPPGDKIELQPTVYQDGSPMFKQPVTTSTPSSSVATVSSYTVSTIDDSQIDLSAHDEDMFDMETDDTDVTNTSDVSTTAQEGSEKLSHSSTRSVGNTTRRPQRRARVNSLSRYSPTGRGQQRHHEPQRRTAYRPRRANHNTSWRPDHRSSSPPRPKVASTVSVVPKQTSSKRDEKRPVNKPKSKPVSTPPVTLEVPVPSVEKEACEMPAPPVENIGDLPPVSPTYTTDAPAEPAPPTAESTPVQQVKRVIVLEKPAVLSPRKTVTLVPIHTKKERTKRRKAKNVSAKSEPKKYLDLPADLRPAYPDLAALGIVLPHPSTGYRPYPPGYKVAKIDLWRSNGEEVFILLPTFTQNIEQRLAMQSLTCAAYSKFLVLPRKDGPMGLLTPDLDDPQYTWKALGDYKNVDELIKITGPVVLQGCPEMRDHPVSVKTLMKFLIQKPQVPLTYPALNRNLEKTGQQCFLPYEGEIEPNPLLDLEQQFGCTPAVADQLIRVCPLRHRGCHWKASRTSKFSEHYNNTHLRFPLLFLCPGADKGCFYLGSNVDDVTKHILGKANAGCERHQQLRSDYDQDRDIAKSAYVMIRVHNPNAILTEGWPSILDFVPKSFTNKQHPDYKRAYAAWCAEAKAHNLYLVPGCPNTVHIRKDPGGKPTAIERAIAKIFPKEESTQPDSVRMTKQQAFRNLHTWSPEVQRTYNVPLEEHTSSASTSANTSTEAVAPEPEQNLRVVITASRDSAFHSTETLDSVTQDTENLAVTENTDASENTDTSENTDATDVPNRPALLPLDSDEQAAETPADRPAPPPVPERPARPPRAELETLFHNDKVGYINVVEKQLVHFKKTSKIQEKWSEYYQSRYQEELNKRLDTEMMLAEARKELEDLKKSQSPACHAAPTLHWLDDEDVL